MAVVKSRTGKERGRAALTDEERRLVVMLKALGNPTRLAILKRLAERRQCICGEIVAATPLAQSTVSQHLKVLKEAGLIQGEVDGPATCYWLDTEGLTWLHRRVSRLVPNPGGGRSHD